MAREFFPIKNTSIAIALATSLVLGVVVTASAVDTWPIFGHDPQRTSASPKLLTPPLEEVARYSRNANPFQSDRFSFTVAHGNIYAAQEGSCNSVWRVVAMDTTTGATTWNKTLGSFCNISFAISGGVLYVSQRFPAEVVTALDASTGAELWQTSIPEGANIESLVVANGRVFITMGDTRSLSASIQALDAANGNKVWFKELTGGLVAAPTYANGRVYVATREGSGTITKGGPGGVFALDASSGQQVWNFDIAFPATDYPPVFSNGKLFIGTSSPESIRSVIALDGDTGLQQWRFDLADYPRALAVSGTQVFAATSSFDSATETYTGFVYDLDASTGTKRWETSMADFRMDTFPSLLVSNSTFLFLGGRRYIPDPFTSRGQIWSFATTDGSVEWKHTSSESRRPLRALEIATGSSPKLFSLFGDTDINTNDPSSDILLFDESGVSNQPPVADAGPDQTVTDTDGDGQEDVTLDGSGSSDPDGTIESYTWTEDGTQITSGVSPTLTLSTGTHAISLTVTDNDGSTDSDEVTITVQAQKEPKDTDGDGLLDSWEENGFDADGDGDVDVNLPALGANPNCKDIFVELDWMKASKHTHKPQQILLKPVIQAFRDAPVKSNNTSPALCSRGPTGIELHIDIGQSPYNGGGIVSLPNGKQHAKNMIFDLRQAVTSSCRLPRCIDFDIIKDRPRNFDPARIQIFHYGVIGHESPGNFAGVADGYGSSLMLFTAPSEENILNSGPGFEALDAVNFMHELGHNLNLGHGGGDNSLFKPNYYSIMNYMWSVPTTPTAKLNLTPGVPRNGRRILDYSNRKLSTLNENSLDECKGVSGAGNVVTFYATEKAPSDSRFPQDMKMALANERIDWNDNASFDGETCEAEGENISANINGNNADSNNPLTTRLKGYNDWNNLRLDFRNSNCFKREITKREKDKIDIRHGSCYSWQGLGAAAVPIGPLPREATYEELEKLSKNLGEAARESQNQLVEIPTLTEWSLFILTLMLLSVLLWWLYKHHVQRRRQD